MNIVCSPSEGQQWYGRVALVILQDLVDSIYTCSGGRIRFIPGTKGPKSKEFYNLAREDAWVFFGGTTMEQLQERHVSQPFTVNALDDILRKLSLPPPWTASPLSSYTVGRRSFLSRADEEGLKPLKRPMRRLKWREITMYNKRRCNAV